MATMLSGCTVVRGRASQRRVSRNVSYTKLSPNHSGRASQRRVSRNHQTIYWADNSVESRLAEARE